MSADANSAFGDALGRNRRPAHSPASRDEHSSFLYQPFASAETSSSPDRIARGPLAGSRPTSAGSVQVAHLSAQSDWLEQPLAAPGALEEWFQAVQAQLGKTFADQVTPVRLAGHISVLLVAAVVLVLSRVEIPDWNFTLRAFPNSSLLSNSSDNDALSMRMAALIGQSGSSLSMNESLQRAAVPFTTVQADPTPVVAEIQSYIVQPGDTVLGIAEKFGLRPETIQWSNPGLEVNADLIRPGDSLNILPVDGAVHTVTSGDTLNSIAAKYKVTVEDIIGYPGNGLSDADAPLALAAKLVIPNGTKPAAVRQVVNYDSTTASTPASAQLGSGTFVWPVSGSINQRYWGGHGGIDLGAWTGAPVKSADSGYVAVARGGWNAGYGNHVIIDHGNGFVTLYAHLNSIYVKPGENVSRGQQIGSVGNTGNSTGPHLHFEIRYQGATRNPLNYLP